MYRCGTLCRLRCTCTGHDRGHAGPDVLAIDHIDGGIQANRPRCSQRLQNAHGRRGALNQCSEHQTDQQAQKRVLHLHKQIPEELRFAQRFHCRTHYGHPIEQDAKAADDLSDVLMVVLFTEHDHDNAQENRNWCEAVELDGNHKAGHRRADVGAHDHADGLRQSHQSGIYEAHNHDCSSRRALDDRCDCQSDQGPHVLIGCQPLNHSFEPGTSCQFQSIAHQFHAIQKESQSTKQHHEVFNCHFSNLPIIKI